MKTFTKLLQFFPLLFLPALFLIGYLTPPKVQKLKTSGAMESMDFWAMQRAYPDKVIPDAGYYAAYEYAKNTFPDNLDNGASGWRAIGPLNISGRTLAITFNPLNGNTLYAGSASGGLWRSYTGGTGPVAWSHIPTGFPVLSVSSIAIPPADSNTIYIGTGEVYAYQNSNGGLIDRVTRGSYGIGILKSTNAGATWTKSLDWAYNQKRGVQVIKINPRNPNVVWAGTTEGTYVSYNAGSSWNPVHNTVMVTDIVINPNDTGTVFIACGNLNSPGNGIYRTLNSGANWTKLTSGLPVTYGGKALLSMYPPAPNVIFASIGFGAQNSSPTQLCKTTDNGNTWVVVSNLNYATYQGWYSHFVGVNPADSSQVYTGGIDIFKSTTGGNGLIVKSAWNIGFQGRTPIGGPEGPPQYSHADHHSITFHPADPDIVYFGNDGGVFRTTNGGESFEACNGSYQTTQFYMGFSSSPTDSIFALGGMQDNSTAIFDGQEAWIRVIGGDGCWTGLNRRNNDTLYGSYQGLNILQSTDKGVNFFPASPPTGFFTAFVAPFVVCYVNPQVMYAGRSVVYRSTDAGATWVITNNGQTLDGNNPMLAMAVSKTNDNVVYCASGPIFSRANVFRTTNGGSNWVNITAGLPERYLIDLAIDPFDDNIVYCTASGYGSGHVYKSTNGGGSWTDITNGLPDVPTTAVIVDPSVPSHIYVGNDLGVYLSTNGGTSWNAFNNGISDAAMVIDLSITDMSGNIRAVTHGRGVFETDLFSQSVGIENNNGIVKGFELMQNYPNPFNPATKIKFTLSSRQSPVKLTVYNSAGKEVAVLVNGTLGAGAHEYTFDGGSLSSGVYFYKLETKDFSRTKKMMLVK
jgi:photosystem II stability/assembly factor-like uncharacterized protein